MEISYEELRDEVISALKKNPIWVLSTAWEGHVSSRSMSIINTGLDVYFQTHSSYIKHMEISKNPNVALCFNNISIEGEAEVIGDWTEEKNQELLKLYQSVHPGSFRAYGLLEGQVVYHIKPHLVMLWKYINGTPIRQNLYVMEERAEQLEFM